MAAGGLHDRLRQCLEDVDIATITKLWGHLYPSMPKLADKDEIITAVHIARTDASNIRLEKRLYSHAWLTERGLPSRLPVILRPKSEQNAPRIVSAVGVSVNSTGSSIERKLEAKELEKVMGDAAGDMIAAGITDPERVSAHMWQARERWLKLNRRKFYV